jgi:hypothetical protein
MNTQVMFRIVIIIAMLIVICFFSTLHHVYRKVENNTIH